MEKDEEYKEFLRHLKTLNLGDTVIRRTPTEVLEILNLDFPELTQQEMEVLLQEMEQNGQSIP